MSKSLNTLITTLMVAAAGNSVAASNVDLTVRGFITPSACVPTLSNGAEINLGKIPAKTLSVDFPTYLPLESLQLTVTCDAATLMALESKDNRAGSHFDSNEEFGLGLINGTEKLGGLDLKIINAVADGVAARTIISRDGGLTWIVDRYMYRNNIISVANASVDAPIPVQKFIGDLKVLPIIAPAKTLTLNEEVPIDGSITLTVRYL